RAFARGYPWTAVYPAAAFFVAVLAFNLFGEGLRRLVQDIGLSFNRLVNRYTLAAAVVLIWGLSWVQSSTGAIAFYKQQAGAFNRAQAVTHLNALTDPALDGRAVGTSGAERAADYIAQKFKEYGLQPGGQKSSYFFEVKRDFFTLTETPRLSFNGQSLAYRQEFAEIPTNFFNASDPKRGQLAVLGFGEQVFASAAFTGQRFPRAVVDLDLSGDTVLILQGGGALPNVLRQGTLYLTRDPADITRRDSLSAYSPAAPATIPLQGAPYFFVTEQAANKMLAPAGLSVAELLARQRQLGPDEVEVWRTGVTAASAMPGRVRQKIPARHVIGYWPGSDPDEDDKLIVVLAQYDGLGVDETGQLYPGANATAGNVAVMLELLRSWQQTGYQPRKTIVFVAYVGEGFDYGQLPSRRPDVERFISAKFGFAVAFTPEAFVFLNGLGAGAGDDLTLAAGGNLRLAQLFERAGKQVGVKTRRANEEFLLDVIFGGSQGVVTEDAPNITLQWTGAEATFGTPADTPEAIDPAKLEQSGRLLSLALLIMGREVNY
ncbi:MAG: M28 family peptidase, partial [Anaerolineae bacterium]